MPRITRPYTLRVRVDPELYTVVTEAAAGRTKTDVVRSALRLYRAVTTTLEEDQR